MATFYSAARAGFFDDRVHPVIPDDAVPVSTERHARLLADQSAGKAIVAGADGRPVARALGPDHDRRRALLIEAAKREAASRIIAIAPVWRQLNDARDLALSGGPTRLAIEARYAAIDAIRAASDALEARIAAITPRGLPHVDVAAPSHWPAQRNRP